MNTGILSAALAFLCWGLFPLYFHAIGDVPPLQILAHRMVWSLLFLVIVLAVRRQWAWLGLVRQPRVFGSFVASALLLSINWLIYIWAVNNGHVIEASLGIGDFHAALTGETSGLKFKLAGPSMKIAFDGSSPPAPTAVTSGEGIETQPVVASDGAIAVLRSDVHAPMRAAVARSSTLCGGRISPVAM